MKSSQLCFLQTCCCKLVVYGCNFIGDCVGGKRIPPSIPAGDVEILIRVVARNVAKIFRITA